MNASALLAALAGLALGLGLGYALSKGAPAPAPAATAQPVLAATPLEPAPEPPPASAPAEPAARAAVRPTSEPAPEPSAPEVAVPAPSAAPTLVAELSAFLRSGALEARLAQHPDQLVQFLVYQYLEAEEPGRALALLERHELGQPWLFAQIAEQLNAAGDTPGAVEALRLAMREGPPEPELLAQLSRLDPAAALAALDAEEARLGAEAASFYELPRAQALAALGRTEEALELARAALARGLLDPDAWGLLAELDPEVAERELRASLADDGTGELGWRLAGLLAEDETRREEALEVLNAALDRAPANGEALELLAELDQDALLARLAAAEETGEWVEPWLWTRAGASLRAAGREAEAAEAYFSAFEHDPTDEAAIEALRELAPSRFWTHCRALTADTRDDELLGDVADLYWTDGRREEAIELWRRANRLDPTDSEWTDKLRRVLGGLDPW